MNHLRSLFPCIALSLLLPQLTHGTTKAGASGADPYCTEPSYFIPKPESSGLTWKVPDFARWGSASI